MTNLNDFNNKFLPREGITCFKSLDGSDVANWLTSIGETVVSNRDTGGHGEAVTESGFVVSTNGYVHKV